MEKRTYTCCLCSETCEGNGNSPYPLQLDGMCCDKCNAVLVVPERLRRAKEAERNE